MFGEHAAMFGEHVALSGEHAALFGEHAALFGRHAVSRQIMIAGDTLQESNDISEASNGISERDESQQARFVERGTLPLKIIRLRWRPVNRKVRRRCCATPDDATRFKREIAEESPNTHVLLLQHSIDLFPRLEAYAERSRFSLSRSAG